MRKLLFHLVILLVGMRQLFAAGPIPGIDSSSKYLQYYGNDFSASQMDLMSQFDVIVLNPKVVNLTPKVVAELQSNGVIVLGYISIGEEHYTVVNPYVGDGKGPVTYQNGQIVELNQGVASFYVDYEYDDNNNYISDNNPDINRNFGGRFVIPNAAWRTLIDTQRIGGTERSLPGLQQLASNRTSDTDTDRTNNFGFDGFFLDTLDTAGPFDHVWGYYPWTAPEMQATVKFIHDSYPDKIVFANRGVFFYNPAIISAVFNIRPYEYTIRPYVHASLFESYLLDSNGGNSGISPYFADNKHNYAPKIIAEASRVDGFTIFCLDYQMNRGESLYQQFIQEAIVLNGWTSYLAGDGTIENVGTYILNTEIPVDSQPPVWDSTQTPGWVSEDVSDNVGIQSVAKGDNVGEIVVHWDVAKDQTMPVKYNIYLSDNSDFNNSVVHKGVQPEVGDNWATDPVNSFAYKYTLQGIAPGTWYLRVRAEDSTPNAYEDNNTVTLSIVLDLTETEVSNPVDSILVDGFLGEWGSLISFGTDPLDAEGENVDWDQCWLAHGGENLYIACRTQNSPVVDGTLNIFFDSDFNSSTGYNNSANVQIGADFLIQGDTLYSYSGDGASWSWTAVQAINWLQNGNDLEGQILLSKLGSVKLLRVVFYGDNSYLGGSVNDLYPDVSGKYFSYRIIRDVDNDGMDDQWEFLYFNNLDQTATGDADDDGLNNLGEFQKRTDPTDVDSDDDRMHDGWEVTYDFNPLVDDAALDGDGDGYSNLAEFLGDLDPTVVDEVGSIIELKPGWNLVAIPKNLTEPTVKSVFQGKEVGNVWEWDNVNHFYVDAKTNEPLSEDKGYWVFVEQIEVIVK